MGLLAYFAYVSAIGIREKYDGNFIFTFAIVKLKVRHSGITTAKIFKHGNYLK